MELTEDEEKEFDRESLEETEMLRNRLRSAKSEDFQIIKLDIDSGEVHWAASLYGCHDIAWFIRKSDAEMFVKAWGEK